MTEKSKKYLSDILMAIDLIEEFTSGFDFLVMSSESEDFPLSVLARPPQQAGDCR